MIATLLKNDSLTRYFSIYQTAVFASIFFLLTIVGTLSHEGAHYVVADCLGLKPLFHYGSITFAPEVMSVKPDAETYRRYFLCMIAGPLQTMLTGLIGLAMLIIRSKRQCLFSKIDLAAVFLSLFWLRECFNLATLFISWIVYGKSFKISGDEANISEYLGFDALSFNVLLGLIGTVICYVTVFVLLPKRYRLNLIVAGFFGSLIGFVVWYGFLGRLVLG